MQLLRSNYVRNQLKFTPASHELNMASARVTSDVYASTMQSAASAIFSYGYFGALCHRTSRNQDLDLFVTFAFVPILHMCETVIKFCLAFYRFAKLSFANGKIPRDDPLVYILGILGLYPKDWPQKRAETWTLINMALFRLRRAQKSENSGFRWTVYIGRIIVLIVFLYQGISASTIYIRRRSLDNATLIFDHLTGIYAISGTLVTIATLIIHTQPFEWTVTKRDKNCPDFGPSNTCLMEMFVAWAVYTTGWLFYSGRAPFALLMLCARSLFIFRLYGFVFLWMIVALHFLIYGIIRVLGGARASGRRISPRLMAVFVIVAGSSVWIEATTELRQVEHGSLHHWNAAWDLPNRKTSFYGTVFSLWSGP